MTVKEEWGMECPSCKRDDQLRIAVKMWADLGGEGTDAEGDQEWDDNSSCVCGCGWSGIVSEAKSEPVNVWLYHIVYTNDDGCDNSLMVRATGINNAVAMWRHYYSGDEDMLPERVFLIGGDETRCGVLQWGTPDLMQVSGTKGAWSS